MVRYERSPRSTSSARSLRRHQTDAERKLWFLLRNRRLEDMTFRRQVPIGPYIADFVCMRRKLVVEADGSQHNESQSDRARDQWFAKEGFAIVRYNNLDILNNPNGVLADLASRLDEGFDG